MNKVMRIWIRGAAQAPALRFGYVVATCVLISSAPVLSQNNADVPPPVPDTFDLETALSYALDNNFAIRQAVEQIEEQEGIIVEVKARTRPTLTLQPDA